MSRHRFKRHAIALAAGSVALFSGCAAPQLSANLTVEPIMAVKNGIEEGERMYRIGRYFQGQLRNDSAEEAFLKALARNPAHVEARNALGTVYFAQGRMQKAEEQFKLAIAAAPERAHLHNNLGYLYLEIRRSDEAVAAFKVARELDPHNPRILNNLAAAEGTPDKAGTAPAVTANATTEPVTAPLPEEPAVKLATPPAQQPSSAPTVQLASVAPNVWELQPIVPPAASAQRVAVAAPAPKPVILAVPAAVIRVPPAAAERMEVANGNGVTGLARRVGLYLREQGYVQPRLTNDKSFTLPRTEIHYVPGAEALARQLGESFAQPPRLVPVARLDRQVPVRLVLGKDFHESEAIARHKGATGKLVALASRTERN